MEHSRLNSAGSIGADLSAPPLSRRWPLLCFGITFVIYALLVPNFLRYASPPTGDQPFYLMDTISLVKDWDLNVANNYANHDEDYFYSLAPHPADFVGMSAPYPLPRQLAISSGRPPEEAYSFHPPGLGILLVPAWIIGGWFSLWWPATIFFMCVVGALIAVNSFLFAYEITGRLWPAISVWLALSFASPIMPYSYMIFSELPTGLLLIYVFRRLALGWRANGPLRLILIGACIGFIPWLALRCLPISVGLCLYALYQWWHANRLIELPSVDSAVSGKTISALHGLRSAARNFTVGVRDFPTVALGKVSEKDTNLVPLLAPIVVLAIVLAAYHVFLFGGLIPPSTELEGSGVGDFHWPWVNFRELTLFTTALFGLFLGQKNGLVTYAPVYLLAVVGLVAMFRTGRAGDRRLLGWAAVTIVPYWFIIAAYDAWGGVWGPPARYLSTLVPAFAAPLAVSLAVLRRNITYNVLYWVLAAIGFAFAAIMIYDPRTMFPIDFSAVFTWLAQAPESPLHVDLRGLIPITSFSYEHAPLTQNVTLFPLRSGGMLLVACSIILVGLALLLRRQRILAPRRGWPLLHRALAISGALVLVLAGWFVMNAQFLAHKTTLTYIRHWQFDAPVLIPGGIAYLDGKVYIPEYGRRLENGWDQGWVGVLDTRTGQYSQLSARTGAGVAIAWSHPSNVKVGPDGMLYVLNNGEKDEALLIMQPDGVVLRKVGLEERSPVSMGMQIASDGSLYIADQVTGLVQQYGPNGGKPIHVWRGVGDVLNNPLGLAISPDGVVYSSESYNRIQEMDDTGRVMHLYDLLCNPVYFAIPHQRESDWIEVSLGCRAAMVSLNTAGHYVQLVDVVGDGPTVVSLRGITYAPDGLLYAMQGNSIIEYRVTH